MKRQRGRNRGGGGGSGGGKPQQNANRAFDSNGPDGVKVRGNAQHVFEKYQQLARDASSAGDRVLAENYLQHAEHYFRLLRALQPQRPASEILGRDQFASGFDIDFEDEGAQAQSEAADEAAESGEAEAGETRENRWQDRPREGRDRDDRRDRDGRDRDGRDRDRGERFEGRRDRDDRPRDRDENRRDRDDRPRDRDENRRDRDDRPRERDENRDRDRDNREGREGGRRERWRDRDRNRDDRDGRGERGDREERRERSDRQDRPERDPMPVIEPQAEPFAAAEAPMLRDAEGGESHAPAFLQAATPRADGDEGPPRRTRRRRAPRSFEADEGAPSSGEPEEA
ncbi:DUF4167 domain-containing protein [Phenylobacterium deserti]